jgi:hypothetical protein
VECTPSFRVGCRQHDAQLDGRFYPLGDQRPNENYINLFLTKSREIASTEGLLDSDAPGRDHVPVFGKP